MVNLGQCLSHFNLFTACVTCDFIIIFYEHMLNIDEFLWSYNRERRLNEKFTSRSLLLIEITNLRCLDLFHIIHRQIWYFCVDTRTPQKVRKKYKEASNMWAHGQYERLDELKKGNTTDQNTLSGRINMLACFNQRYSDIFSYDLLTANMLNSSDIWKLFRSVTVFF